MSASNNINKLIVTIVFLFLISVTAFFAWNYLKKDAVKELVIGAGLKKGEAYKFANFLTPLGCRNIYFHYDGALSFYNRENPSLSCRK